MIFDKLITNKIVRSMKREVGVLLAGGIGLLAVLGILGAKKLINKKHHKQYDDYYTDYHNNFEDTDYEDDHGIEFYAMK